MKLSILSAVGAAVLLSACGGSGTSSVTLEELIARGQAFEGLSTTLNIDEVSPTPNSTLTSTGSADFTGIAITARQNAADEDLTDFAAIGSAKLNVDFATGVVAGSADNFFQISEEVFDDDEADLEDITGAAIAGSVSYNLTQTNDGENLFEGTVTGALTEGGGGTVVLDLPAAGGLVGPNADGFVVEAFEEEGLIGFAVLATKD